MLTRSAREFPSSYALIPFVVFVDTLDKPWLILTNTITGRSLLCFFAPLAILPEGRLSTIKNREQKRNQRLF